MKRIVALGLLLAIGLTACSEEAEPRMGGAAASTSPQLETPASSATTPDTEGADEDGREAPKAFFRRWHEANSQLFTSGDASALRALSAPRCTSCAATIDLVEGIYTGRGTIQYTPGRLLSVRHVRDRSYLVRFSVPAYRYRRTPSSEWVEVPKDILTLRFDLRPSGRTWQITESYDRPENY